MNTILLVCQSQDGSCVNLLNEALSQNDYVLTVLTGKKTDISDKVFVVDAPKYDSNSFISRFKTWFSFSFAAKKFLRQNIDKFDAVMFTSNPPVNQSLVRYVQKKGKKSIYLIWDIYPDCIEKTFGKKVLPITYFWRKLNSKVYKNCDVVLTIGEVMKENILKSYPGLDIRIIPYHADIEFIRPIPKEENPFVIENGLLGKKVFMYSGKMGFGHGFDEMLEVARQLKDRDDIIFMFIGHGQAYKDIERFIIENNLTNAKILPYQPLNMLPYSLGAADVAFITIKQETDGLFLPSKVYDAMASGSAVISISGKNNDVAVMLEKEKIGICVNPGNTDELKQAVLKFVSNTEYLDECQQNARRVAVDKYRVESVINRYAEIFNEVL